MEFSFVAKVKFEDQNSNLLGVFLLIGDNVKKKTYVCYPTMYSYSTRFAELFDPKTPWQNFMAIVRRETKLVSDAAHIDLANKVMWQLESDYPERITRLMEVLGEFGSMSFGEKFNRFLQEELAVVFPSGELFVESGFELSPQSTTEILAMVGRSEREDTEGEHQTAKEMEDVTEEAPKESEVSEEEPEEQDDETTEQDDETTEQKDTLSGEEKRRREEVRKKIEAEKRKIEELLKRQTGGKSREKKTVAGKSDEEKWKTQEENWKQEQKRARKKIEAEQKRRIEEEKRKIEELLNRPSSPKQRKSNAGNMPESDRTKARVQKAAERQKTGERLRKEERLKIDNEKWWREEGEKLRKQDEKQKKARAIRKQEEQKMLRAAAKKKLDLERQKQEDRNRLQKQIRQQEDEKIRKRREQQNLREDRKAWESARKEISVLKGGDGDVELGLDPMNGVPAKDLKKKTRVVAFRRHGVKMPGEVLMIFRQESQPDHVVVKIALTDKVVAYAVIYELDMVWIERDPNVYDQSLSSLGTYVRIALISIGLALIVLIIMFVAFFL